MFSGQWNGERPDFSAAYPKKRKRKKEAAKKDSADKSPKERNIYAL